MIVVCLGEDYPKPQAKHWSPLTLQDDLIPEVSNKQARKSCHPAPSTAPNSMQPSSLSILDPVTVLAGLGHMLPRHIVQSSWNSCCAVATPAGLCHMAPAPGLMLFTALAGSGSGAAEAASTV